MGGVCRCRGGKGGGSVSLLSRLSPLSEGGCRARDLAGLGGGGGAGGLLSRLSPLSEGGCWAGDRWLAWVEVAVLVGIAGGVAAAARSRGVAQGRLVGRQRLLSVAPVVRRALLRVASMSSWPKPCDPD